MDYLIFRDPHFARQCPKFDDMEQWSANFTSTRTPQDAKVPRAGSKPPPSPTQPRPPNQQANSSFFGENASMAIFNLSCPAEESVDPVMLSIKSTLENPWKMLFFLQGIIQNKTH